MDAVGQQRAVQDMINESGNHDYGLDVILPNVRAMCGIYPPNTSISAVFTG